ncbi:hypothetical protein NQ314_014144 [Rhamnusium bicolor]|uniref:PiggyBac transposable element-derived protein domain-containing protein n=1 Tax=Rhamnusium bicolor TaxID=1586634 RepID=A0AAV8X2Q3_9CUCU|nr:hypothetical protein NQ314_014144 [Rhamnusium bicolor]
MYTEPDVDDWDSEDELPLSYVAKESVVWTKDYTLATHPTPFEEPYGPNVSEDIETPLDNFLLFFMPEFFKKLVSESNLYATQEHGDRFTPTNLEEIKCFFGINILMGLTKKPSYKDYWSSKFEMRDPFISSAMSRDRFDCFAPLAHEQ